jgi:cell division septation protein DedD
MGRAKPGKNSRSSPFGLLGAILLAVWMFILGVWVGQGGLAWLIEPEPKPTSLAALLGQGQPPPVSPPAPTPPGGAPTPPPAPKTVPSPPPVPPAPARPAPSPPTAARPQPTAPPARPRPTPPQKPAPTPKPSPKTERPQAVVVASVTSLEAARRLAARWRKLGVAVLWVKAEVSGRVRYRLRTVKTYSFAEARKALDRLRKLGQKMGTTRPWIIGVDR